MTLQMLAVSFPNPLANAISTTRDGEKVIPSSD